MIFAAVAAAGQGLRMGGGRPKQFRSLAGRSVLAHLLARLAQAPVDGLLVALPYDWLNRAHRFTAEAGLTEGRVTYLAGGLTRGDTLAVLVRAALERDPMAALVSHDAARPFVPLRLVREHLAALQIHRAVNTLLPARDSLVCRQGGRWVAVDRKGYAVVQTPQSFYARDWLQAWESLAKAERVRYTDALALLAERGVEVAAIEGDSRNFKLTAPDDWEMAEALARSWN